MADSYCDCLGETCSRLADVTRERDQARRQLAALQKRYNALMAEKTESGEMKRERTRTI